MTAPTDQPPAQVVEPVCPDCGCTRDGFNPRTREQMEPWNRCCGYPNRETFGKETPSPTSELTRLRAELAEAEEKILEATRTRHHLVDCVVKAEAERDGLREALRLNYVELFYCADQLKARGAKGHPGDSVSRALAAGKQALASTPAPQEAGPDGR